MKTFSEFVVALSQYLRERRDEIVTPRTMLEPRFDPTYGPQDPVEVTVDVVDFDALMDAIDRFGEELRERNQ